MKRYAVLLFFVLSLVFIATVLAQENITITTYYPSPYGSYNNLTVINNLSVGTASTGIGRLTVIGAGTDANGFLRLENTAGSYRSIYLMSDSELRFNNGTTVGSLSNASNWVNGSDRAYKKDIMDMSKYGLETVLMMKPREYKMKADDSPQIGFIAQEMQELIPEVVSGEEGHLGIAYGNLTAVLTKAIKELKAENDNLKERMEILEEKISRLEK
jgi:hypothetical protein